MDTANVRYIVNNVDEAIEFYRALGFEVQMRPAPEFAMLTRGSLRLLLNSPGGGGAGQTLNDGATPAPGGWNRIQLEVEDLPVRVDELKHRGIAFRNEMINGIGGRQALVQDPSGNLVELFESY